MAAKYAIGLTGAMAMLMSVLLVALYVRAGYSWIFLITMLGYCCLAARTLVLQWRDRDGAVERMKWFAWPSGMVGLLAGLLVYAMAHGLMDLEKLGYPQPH